MSLQAAGRTQKFVAMRTWIFGVSPSKVRLQRFIAVAFHGTFVAFEVLGVEVIHVLVVAIEFLVAFLE